MRKRTVWVALALAGLILIMAAPQRGQTAPAQSSDKEHARRSAAVNTLRAINTAEYVYRSMHGTFARWDVLVASEIFSGRRMHFAAQNAPHSRMPIFRSGRYCRDGRSAST